MQVTHAARLLRGRRVFFPFLDAINPTSHVIPGQSKVIDWRTLLVEDIDGAIQKKARR